MELKTKGCCFFCLQTIGSTGETFTVESVSLQCLIKEHLKIKTEYPVNKTKQGLNAFLCKDCKVITERLSKLFKQLEKVKLEIDYFVETISQRISENYRNPDLVQNYSKLMTGDPESLSQLAFVDKLRKQILSKSSSFRLCSHAKVPIIRVKAPVKKEPSLAETVNERAAAVVKIEIVAEGELSSPSSPTPSPSPPSSPAHHVSDDNDDEVQTKAEVGTKTSFQFKKKQSFHSPLPTPSIHSQNFQEQEKLQVTSLRGNKYVKDPVSGMLKCATCGKKYKSKSGLWDHYRTHHHAKALPRAFKCWICKAAGFSSIKDLKVHKEICSAKEGNQLQRLPPTFSKINLKSGRKNSGFTLDKETGVYCCSICNDEFGSRLDASDHYKKVHLGIEFKCDLCNDAVFKMERSLWRHKKTCKEVRQRKLEKMKRYKHLCTTCGKKYSSKDCLNLHRKSVHLNIRNYACNLCNQKFKSSNSLKHHVDRKHLKKSFQCEICHKKCTYRWALKKHQRTCSKFKVKNERNNQ